VDKARAASFRSEVQFALYRSTRKSGDTAMLILDFVDVQHDLSPSIIDEIWSGCNPPFPNKNQSLEILLWGVIDRRLR
jgi:hypothetical protein